MQSLAIESDRGCVLAGATAIENRVEELLRKYLEKTSLLQHQKDTEDCINFLIDREPMPPLGNHGVRLRACFVLGLISRELFHQMKRLTTLRNEFAHSFTPVELTDRDILKLTDPSKWTGRIKALLGEIKSDCKPLRKHSDTRQFSEPRYHLMLVCLLIHHELSLACARDEIVGSVPEAAGVFTGYLIRPSEWTLPPPSTLPE